MKRIIATAAVVTALAVPFQALSMDKGISEANAPIANEAYQAVAAGRMGEAELLVKKALESQPDCYELRMLLVEIAQKRGDWSLVERELSAVAAAFPNDGYVLASLGFARQNMGQRDKAEAAFKAAKATGTLTRTMVQNVNAALKGIAVQKMGGVSPVRTPNVFSLLETARADIAAGRLDNAEKTLAAIERERMTEKDKALATFLTAELLWGRNRYDEAYAKYDSVKNDAALPLFYRSESFWKMAEYHNGKKEIMAALGNGRKSVVLMPDSSVRNLQMAYLALANARDKEATEYFERAFQAKVPEAGEDFVLTDAAYAYKRIGNNEKLLDYLERVIDMEAEKIASSAQPAQNDVEMHYRLRREHADVTRRFGANTGLYYARTDRGNYGLYGIQELYWQPYYSNGRLVQVYGQVAGNLASDIYVDGKRSIHAVIGARTEPLSEYNLVLGMDHVFRIGDETKDQTRLRVAHSWDTGLELEPFVPNWQYTTLFQEYIYGIEDSYSQYYGEGRMGWSFRLDSIDRRLAVSPHAFVWWGFDSRQTSSNQWSAYAGPGLHFRKWYREDRYNAPETYLDVILQYRVGVTRDTDNAFFLTLSHSF